MLALCARANHWNPNEYQYSNNMTVIGIIAFDDVEQRSESLEIGAFCGDECRGSAMAQYDSNFDRYYVCIMIYGNDGDSISIRCYDNSIGMEMDTVSQMSFIFNTNDMIGNAVEPVVFSFDLPEDPVDPEDPEIPVDTIYYHVTAEAYPLAAGTIDGVGEYLENDTCVLRIMKNLNYVYEGLFENDTLVTSDTIYSFAVTFDRYFVAKFSEIPENPEEPIYYQITATIKPEGAGTIIGLGEYKEGEVCNLEITVNEGYSFVSIEENNEIISVEQIYTFEVETDHNFIVNFILTESVEEHSFSSLTLYPNPVNDRLYIDTECEIRDVVIFDIYGKIRYAKIQNAKLIDVSGLNNGVYFVIVKTDDIVVIRNFVKQ